MNIPDFTCTPTDEVTQPLTHLKAIFITTHSVTVFEINIVQMSFYVHRYFEQNQTIPVHCSKPKKVMKSKNRNRNRFIRKAARHIFLDFYQVYIFTTP